MIKTSFKKLLGSAVMFTAMLSAVMLVGIKADAASNVSISKENFPDKTIRKIATAHDKNEDGYLSIAEIKKIKKVKIGQKTITSFKGVEKFSHLKTFIYKGNVTTSQKVDLDLSKNKKLKRVEIAYASSGSDQSIRKINLQGCKKLEILRVVGQTKQINLTGCTNLKELYLHSEGGLQTLDVSDCKKLKKLNVAKGPKLKKIKFGKIKSLKELEIRNCKKLNALNIKKQTKLHSLTMFNLPKLQSLNVSKNVKLQAISLVQVPVTEINLSAHTKLSHFHCAGTNLKKLDLSATKIREAMKDNDEYFRCYDEAVEVIFAK